jgi:hypothetical protein
MPIDAAMMIKDFVLFYIVFPPFVDEAGAGADEMPFSSATIRQPGGIV